MPVKLSCPGVPMCRHVFTFVPALRAHILSCKYAQDKHFDKDIDTTLEVVEFVNDKQKGNITIAREDPPSTRWEKPYFSSS